MRLTIEAIKVLRDAFLERHPGLEEQAVTDFDVWFLSIRNARVPKSEFRFKVPLPRRAGSSPLEPPETVTLVHDRFIDIWRPA